MHGQFIWYELTTPDVDAAIKFYPRFTGWGTQPFDKDYTMWTTGGAPFAGLFRLNDEMRQRGVPPNWMAYIEADNVDETVKKAEAIGGKTLVGPDDIPNTGRFAVLQDPQGATFGVYKSSNPLGGRAWDGTPVLGRFSWHELMTTDYEKAFAFYSAVFDWEKTGEMDMGGGMMYFMFGKGGKAFGGMFNTPPEMAGMHPFWLMYVLVKDVGAAVKTATKAGATVQRPQMDIPGGSIAILGDPQGAGFAVHHESAPSAAAKPAEKPKKKASAATRAKNAVKKVAKKVAKTAANVRKAATKAVKKVAKKAARKAPKKAPAKKAPAKKAAKPTVRARTKARVKSVARRVSAKKAKRAGRPRAKKR
jgi:predicted enzyme related to lactoylglutathione lyase